MRGTYDRSFLAFLSMGHCLAVMVTVNSTSSSIFTLSHVASLLGLSHTFGLYCTTMLSTGSFDKRTVCRMA